MFSPLNALERLLIAAAEDASANADFYEALLGAELYVAPSPGQKRNIADLRGVELPDGRGAAAVFSAQQRIAAAFGDQPEALGLQGRMLLERLRPGPVVLNPGSLAALAWDEAQLDAVLSGASAETLPRPMRLSLTEGVPQDLVARLRRFLEGYAGIEEAYLLPVKRKRKEAFLLGVRTSGDFAPAQRLIAQAATGYDFKGRTLDVVQIDTADIAQALRQGVPVVAPRGRGVITLLKG